MEGIDVSFPHIGIKIANMTKGITVGGFTIAFYGMIIALGMVAGLLIARWQAKRTGQDPDVYSDFAIYGIIFAIIGARLYFVIFSFDQYRDNLLQIFNLRGGGMAIYGGVIGGVLSAFVYCRLKKYSFLKMADTACAGLILGQIIGRWGNFFNREAFGGYTNNLLAMQIPLSAVRSSDVTDNILDHVMVIDGTQYIQVHPTFLYESLWNLGLLIILLLIRRKKKFDGEIFLGYLFGYGIGRFWIESLRTDQLLIPGIGYPVSMALAAVLVIISAVWIIVGRRKAVKETA